MADDPNQAAIDKANKDAERIAAEAKAADLDRDRIEKNQGPRDPGGGGGKEE
jgi:hypothetical protein